MIAFRATADSEAKLDLDVEELVEARWFHRTEVERACAAVEGESVMLPEVAKAAFERDPDLTLLVPPKNVVARDLIDAWLSE